MIQSNGCNDRAVGINKIDRIQATTQADLEDRTIQFRLLQDQQTGQCRKFKISQRYFTTRRFNLLKCADQAVIRYRLTHDADALIKTKNMWGSVSTKTLTQGTAHDCQVGDGRTFAIGAGNGKYLTGRPGRTHPLIDSSAAFKTKFDILRMTLFEQNQPGF